MRWLFTLLLLTACSRDRGPRTAPYMPEPASSSSDGTDAGDPMRPDGGGPSTAPTIQPQPGDIQL